MGILILQLIHSNIDTVVSTLLRVSARISVRSGYIDLQLEEYELWRTLFQPMRNI